MQEVEQSNICTCSRAPAGAQHRLMMLASNLSLEQEAASGVLGHLGDRGRLAHAKRQLAGWPTLACCPSAAAAPRRSLQHKPLVAAAACCCSKGLRFEAPKASAAERATASVQFLHERGSSRRQVAPARTVWTAGR